MIYLIPLKDTANINGSPGYVCKQSVSLGYGKLDYAKCICDV